MLVLLNGVLALTESVPELDGSITSSGDDLSVISREADRENITSVRSESSDGLTSSQIPQSEGLVPTTGEGVVAITGEGEVTDSAVVSGQSLLGEAWSLTVGGEFPNNNLLITRRGDDGVGVLETGGDTSDEVGVTLEVTLMNQLDHYILELIQEMRYLDVIDRDRKKNFALDYGRM